ncbi:MAG TPA: MBL fold metallo-hydrolase [Anaeromyxobacteraceae bacterium]|nr:MBL fold metallo-hydrolase [Anaeromyxobacteraceae bacterium]
MERIVSRRVSKDARTWRTLPAALGMVVLAACAQVPPQRAPPATQQRPLSALMKAAAFPNSDLVLVLLTMQQLTAAHREWEGYAYFGLLAEEQPQRRVLFRSLQAAMQARVASDVSLLRRVAWVEDAIRKLDEGAAAEPLLGRLARGLVLADLPARFGKATQAIEDLNWCLAHRVELPLGLDRGMYRGLAAAYRTSGDRRRSEEMLVHAGLASLDDPAVPRVLGDVSVDAARGFRFGAKRLVEAAEGVYVAEGYDFSNLAFIVGRTFVVAIDAGTTEETAREAVAALRRVTQAPIRYVILTHGHWDHVGGLAAVREPGSTVIARSGFAEELQRSRDYHAPFQYFFGTGTMKLDARPDRIVTAPETLSEGGVELELIPARSGETADALFIHDRRHDLLFVGDAFMPYVGAPFVAEGSPEGFLGAIDMVLERRPRRLIHGHPPLTALFTIEAMPGLRDAMGELYRRSLHDVRAARPLADVLHDDFLPDSLRAAPAAVQPYLVARDTFVQRLYTEHAGYWQSNGDGIDAFTRGEWASVLDALGGGSDDSFVRVSRDLERRGDAALALHVADLGLASHPASAPLRESRERALRTLREIHSQTNPFRFIVYSEWAGRGLEPVSPAGVTATATVP